MSAIEIHSFRSPESDIPEEIKEKCRPGAYVWRLTVVCDDLAVRQIEQLAYDKTRQSTYIDNDIYRDGICPTKTARVVHAIEHVIVMNFLKTGQIPESELLRGNIALTVPGTASDGSEIAAFWVRNGLLEDQVIEDALASINQLLYTDS